MLLIMPFGYASPIIAPLIAPAKSHEARIYQIGISVAVGIFLTVWNVWAYRRARRWEKKLAAAQKVGTFMGRDIYRIEL
jgi:type VI protein secretion system component VasK